MPPRVVEQRVLVRQHPAAVERRPVAGDSQRRGLGPAAEGILLRKPGTPSLLHFRRTWQEANRPSLRIYLNRDVPPHEVRSQNRHCCRLHRVPRVVPRYDGGVGVGPSQGDEGFVGGDDDLLSVEETSAVLVNLTKSRSRRGVEPSTCFFDVVSQEGFLDE